MSVICGHRRARAKLWWEGSLALIQYTPRMIVTTGTWQTMSKSICKPLLPLEEHSASVKCSSIPLTLILKSRGVSAKFESKASISY